MSDAANAETTDGRKHAPVALDVHGSFDQEIVDDKLPTDGYVDSHRWMGNVRGYMGCTVLDKGCTS